MKFIVVTGAYGGMGAKTVEELTNKGFTVFALDRKVGEPTKNVVPIETDLTDVVSIENAFEKIKTFTNSLYAIVHFAGLYMLDSLVEMPSEDFERIFKVNFASVFQVNKTFIPLLKNGSKIIITTSELAPLNPLPFTGVYAVSKSALEKYAFSLRMELQLLGVSVSTIRAGAVSTGMLNVSMNALDNFCNKTTNYKCNADRFRKIVNSVESKSVPSERIAKLTLKILQKNKPKFVYNVNRNKLLLLLNILPKRMQFFIIKKILHSKNR